MEKINNLTLQHYSQLMPQQSEFQSAMAQIRNDPLQFLENNLILNPSCHPHHSDTFFAEVSLTRDDGTVRLNEVETGITSGDVILFTDMRDNNAPDRFDAPTIVSVRDQNVTLSRNDVSQTIRQNPPLWLTSQQSGCTVLIARHGRSETGDQQYSMIHMRPRDGEDFVGELTEELYANTQEILLERDIHRTLVNTFLHGLPEDYILVPSEENFMLRGDCTQLIGIGNELGEFNFYKQTYPMMMGDEHRVEALNWTPVTPPDQHLKPPYNANLV